MNERQRFIDRNHALKSIVILSFGLILSSAFGQVKIQVESVPIPTYKPGKPGVMPRFYEGRNHQGVQRRVYPYPMDDNLTDNLVDQNYTVIHVENDFIDLGIIPELGGRIYYAVDKTNNYNWFYHNHVVKPSLIGMVGNWISGSLAWGFPHHHGPNTVEPMDYKIEENADGGKTVWISNTDRRHRMAVVVGYTVYPNSSFVEMTLHPMNRTAIANSFLFWANPAVHCDSSYQVIFPPSVQYVTFHGKRDMTAWPIADSRFNNYDFTGMNVSWWKNTHVPSSFFSWDPREDYFGGYDHKKKAGTVWVGNHYVSPGMKYWADGNNPTGVRINKGLTDNDGRYIELMAGFYTDNQPDYSWLQPYETKIGTMIWFPMRGLEGLKYANRNGALNLEITKDRGIMLRMNATSPYKQASVVLKAKGRTLLQETIDISPAEPFQADVAPAAGIQEDDLDVSLIAADGATLLSYRPAEHHPPKVAKPEPLKAPAGPKELKSVEELYLAGLRLNQFYNASVDPMPYYLEALKRDPGDYRVNTQLGILNIKDFKWIEAEKNLTAAVDRITSNYTRPKDGEGLYYLGVAKRALGKTDEAYDCFYRATWSSAWHTAGYYQLAEMDCQRGDFTAALEHLNLSIQTNSDNHKALDLKAVALRKLNRTDEAEEVVLNTLKNMKIDHQALNELVLLNSGRGDAGNAGSNLKELNTIMRDDVQSYLELATDYGNCDFFAEAIDVLTRLERKSNSFPMLYYYLGYYGSMQGDRARALKYYETAATMPGDYCFPFRAEEIEILRNAMAANPADSYAPYYLGNLLYEHQPEQAVIEWEKSRLLNPSFYIVHRNLGLAYREVQKDNVKALASMQKAVACTGGDPRLLFEIDVLNELNRVSPRMKYEVLKKNFNIVKNRSETLLRLATRSVEYGKFDEAIKILTTYSINESEGAREMQNTYIDAHVLKGMELIQKSKTMEALKDVETAMAYPSGGNRSRFAQFYYLMGLIHKNTGDIAKADSLFQKAIEVKIEGNRSDGKYLYYQGLALQATGKTAEADKVFKDMLNEVENVKEGNAFFTQFERGLSNDARTAANRHVAGLALEGLGEKEKAKNEFTEALKIVPGDIWSRIHLEALTDKSNNSK
jgi:tetratricopeptide (TPR) repeat protein